MAPLVEVVFDVGEGAVQEPAAGGVEVVAGEAERAGDDAGVERPPCEPGSEPGEVGGDPAGLEVGDTGPGEQHRAGCAGGVADGEAPLEQLLVDVASGSAWRGGDGVDEPGAGVHGTEFGWEHRAGRDAGGEVVYAVPFGWGDHEVEARDFGRGGVGGRDDRGDLEHVATGRVGPGGLEVDPACERRAAGHAAAPK